MITEGDDLKMLVDGIGCWLIELGIYNSVGRRSKPHDEIQYYNLTLSYYIDRIYNFEYKLGHIGARNVLKWHTIS
jgi:hypothetical protein